MFERGGKASKDSDRRVNTAKSVDGSLNALVASKLSKEATLTVSCGVLIPILMNGGEE